MSTREIWARDVVLYAGHTVHVLGTLHPGHGVRVAVIMDAAEGGRLWTCDSLAVLAAEKGYALTAEQIRGDLVRLLTDAAARPVLRATSPTSRA